MDQHPPNPHQQIGAVIKDELLHTGNTHSWLAVEVARIEGRPQPYTSAVVTHWVKGTKFSSPAQLMAIEKALNLPAGRLTRILGYVSTDAIPAATVPEALDLDASLTPTKRAEVLEVYLRAVDASAKARAARTGKRPQ